MKKRNTCLFLLILLLLLGCVSSLFDSAVFGGNLAISERNRHLVGVQQEKKNTLEVLVAGDSLSYTSVSPMEIWKKVGVTVYDCGQSGQRIPETYYILKTAMKTQKPKVIFLETNLLYRYHGIVKEAVYSLNEAGNYYFPVFRYHNLWKSFIGEKSKDIRTDYKGFMFRTEVDSYSGKSEYHKKGDFKEISPYVKYYVKQILALCEKNGVQLVFYSAPSPLNYCKKRIENLKKYTEELQIPYLNLTEKRKEIKLNWKTDTLDKGDHLNIYGARKVSHYLGEYLIQNYQLKDHRGEKEYKEWDELAAQYDRELSEIERQ